MAAVGVCFVACAGGAAPRARVLGHDVQALLHVGMTEPDPHASHKEAKYALLWIEWCENGLPQIDLYYKKHCPEKLINDANSVYAIGSELFQHVRYAYGKTKSGPLQGVAAIEAKIDAEKFFGRIDFPERSKEMTWFGGATTKYSNPQGTSPPSAPSGKPIGKDEFCDAIKAPQFAKWGTQEWEKGERPRKRRLYYTLLFARVCCGHTLSWNQNTLMPQ